MKKGEIANQWFIN